ncbi:MAG TPA: hypothetical protein VN578_00775 [Candidatus Binatia bacterium]|jgi:hypothetical protein|nr:hypothetical protein [Candidatus Binatia bacterium]
MKTNSLSLALAAFFCAAAASAQTTTNTYALPAISCSGYGEICSNTFNQPVRTSGVLTARYTAPAADCSYIRIHFLVDGQERAETEILVPGAASSWFNLGPVAHGSHLLQLQAEGFIGGCNTGSLSEWSGKLDVVTATGPTPSIFPAVEISFPTVTNTRYQVEWSTNLAGTNWQPLGAPLTGTGTNVSAFDSTRSGAMRFYIVLVVP